MLILFLSILAITGPAPAPIIERVTPAEGGFVWWWSADLTVAFGHTCEYHYEPTWFSISRPFLWSRETGTVYFSRFMALPSDDVVVQDVREQPSVYVVLLQDNDPSKPRPNVWRVELPRGLASLRSPADLDRDGDVDQSDFGLLQRQLGQPGCPMTVAEFLRSMGGAR